MGKLLPILLILIGVGGGVGAGLALRPGPASDDHTDPTDQAEAVAVPDCPASGAPNGSHSDDSYDTDNEFVKLSNQFVVPVLANDEIDAMVVLSISLEVATGSREQIFQREPKLRDGFLQVLFDHSNAGGFEGNYISSAALDDLRRALSENAKKVAGPSVIDVLIVDFVKQSV